MFARSALKTVAPVGRRNASTSVANVVSNATYWAKVTAEVSKQVYVKEGLQPPTVAEFQKVADCASKLSAQLLKDPKAVLETVGKTAQGTSKNEYLKYLAYFVQIVGFFSLGEMVGRRNVVGYKEYH